MDILNFSAYAFPRNVQIRRWNILFYAQAVLVVFLTLISYTMFILGRFYYSTTETILMELANALFIISPLCLLTPKWRWVGLLPIWIVSVFCIANLWYFLFFDDMIPFMNMFAFNNFDSILFKSSFFAARPSHILLIAGPLCYTIFYCFFRKKLTDCSTTLNITKRLLGFSLMIMPFIFVEAYMIGTRRYQDKSFIERAYLRYTNARSVNSYYTYFEGGGISQYFLRNIGTSIYKTFRNRDLNSNQTNQILGFLSKHDRHIKPNTALTPIFKLNRDKNLILIVVESFNSVAVNATVNGHQVMPTLNKLLNDSSTISCLNVKSQIHSGVSSDGQFILNTGLLPADDATTVLEYGDNIYPGLAKQLKRYSFEVIGEGSSFWNHYKTNITYGYDTIIDNTDYRADEQKISRDHAIMQTALAEITKAKRPFYSFVTTIGMHSPYLDDNVPEPRWLTNDTQLSQDRKNYYNMCNNFDKAFDEFIQGLKHVGLYENTIVCLASDHAILEGKSQKEPIIFIAINTGVHKIIDRTVQQIDIYPTILEIMGRYPSASNNGLGYSMLQEAVAQNEFEAQKISNLLIFANWFANHK